MKLEPIISRLERFILYETISQMYLVGFDELKTSFRVIKINRIENPTNLEQIVSCNNVVYSKNDLAVFLDTIHEANKTTGGLIKVTEACGIIGFVQFLDCYYLNLITQRREVGCIGGNLIYSVKANEIVPIKPKGEIDSNAFKKMWQKLNKKINQTSKEIAESRYMGLFQFVDVSKDFFFSYTYDMTHSLQYNYIMSLQRSYPPPPSQELYEWNHYQTEELRNITGEMSFSLWIIPLIHGSFEQKRFSLFGRSLDMMLIARRSRHYAGTRYLKRGVSTHGKVANDCETEQILQVDGGEQLNFSSYVQMRGSIPTYWYQEASVTTPKPPILINRVDPSYLATQEHFSDLFARYSSPIIVLDLVKQLEKKPRESIVGKELYYAVEELNISISDEHKIRYCALDHSRISKSKQNRSIDQQITGEVASEWAILESSVRAAAARADSKSGNGGVNTTTSDSYGVTSASTSSGRVDILRQLEDIAGMSLFDTSIFCCSTKFLCKVPELKPEHIERAMERGYIEQRGVLRTNCIDCLDRTNAGQFAMALKFVSVAIRALGISNESHIDASSKLLLALMDMFGVMGDRIALQYGGSEAHKKMSFGKVEPKSTSKHGSELLTSIKRYYSNAFTDMVKQDAMNIFLGCYVPSDKKTPLWDLDSDYHLHNRSLHPPVPYIHKLLFHELRRLSDYEKVKLSREENIVDILSRIPETDVDAVIAKYFIRPNDNGILSEGVKKCIIRSEKRKFIAECLRSRVLDATEMWWKESIHLFYSRRRWMCLPPSPQTQLLLSKSYFNRFYKPGELTFFDPIFSQLEYVTPLDCSTDVNEKSDQTIKSKPFTSNVISPNRSDDRLNDLSAAVSSATNTSHSYSISNINIGMENNSTFQPIYTEFSNSNHPYSNSANALAARSFSPISFKYIDDDAATETASVANSQSHHHQQQSQNSFQLSRYVREIGLKARNIVGGYILPRKDSSVNDMVNIQESDHLFDHETSLKAIWEDNITKIHPVISMKSGLLYSKYAEVAKDPWIMFDNCGNSNHKAEEEFHESLHDYNIDADAMHAMEHLAIDAYINNVISQGPYKGILQMDSALDAQFRLSSNLVLLEEDLATPSNYDSSNSGSDNNSKSSSNSNSNSNKYQNRNRKTSTTAAQDHLAALCSKLDIPEGLATETANMVNRYLIEQNKYSIDISSACLSNRSSPMTNERAILQYCSYFNQQSLGSSIDVAEHILSDNAACSSYTTFNSLVKSIEPFKDEYCKAKDEVVAKDTGNYAHDNESITSCLVSQELSNKKIVDINQGEWYEDFTCIQPDLYTRISNPFMIMNEAAVKAFTKSVLAS